MKNVKIKSGTKEEIIKYVLSKIKKNKLVELKNNTVEQQIDFFIQSGSPLVVITLNEKSGNKKYREQFLLTNYGNLRLDMELERADNMELRDRRLQAIKMLINMELDAEERWDRILKVVEDYKNILIPMEICEL